VHENLHLTIEAFFLNAGLGCLQVKESITVPIYKEVDKTGCSNFQGRLLLPNTYKILPTILLSRLSPHAEEIIGEHQCGFKRNRSTADRILCI
jgi:hypothetical protein